MRRLWPDASREDVDLRLEFVHREDAALLRGVPLAEAAVLAAVHAEVGHVERREHHDAVVVDLVLDAVRRRAHFLEERRIRDGHEDGRLLGEKRLARRLALRDYLPHARRIRRLFRDLGYAAVYLRLVDEMPAAGEILVYLLLNDEIPAVVVRILELPYLRYIRHLLKLAFNAHHRRVKRVLYHNCRGLRPTCSPDQGFQMMRPSRLRRVGRIICARVFMPPPANRRYSRQSAPLPPPRRGHAATALGRTCPSCRVKGSCAARTCGASRRTRP